MSQIYSRDNIAQNPAQDILRETSVPRYRMVARLKRLLLAIIVYLGVIIAISPFLWILLTSFKTPEDTFKNPPVIIFRPTLENYRLVLFEREFNFTGAFLNSVIITSISTLVSVIFGAFTAYSLARLPLPGKSILSHLILWTRLLPSIALVIPLYLILDQSKLLDTRLGLIIVYTAFNVPIVVWILRGFFAEFPKELEESAIIDGSSRLQTFLKIILPLSTPSLSATAALSAFWIWNDFLFAFIFSRREAVTLIVMASRFQEEEGVRWGQVSAASMIAILPVFIFTFLVQKYIIQGLLVGSIKG